MIVLPLVVLTLVEVITSELNESKAARSQNLGRTVRGEAGSTGLILMCAVEQVHLDAAFGLQDCLQPDNSSHALNVFAHALCCDSPLGVARQSGTSC